MNFPDWVTDDTPIPAGKRVRAKKILYAFGANTKLRLLFNAGWKWVRHRPLDADEETLLAATFPGQWPNAPSEEQFRNVLKNWYEPRRNAVLSAIANFREALESLEMAWVDLDGLID